MATPISRFPQWPRPVRQLMPGLGTSADGMSVQQRFMEVIARNLANAETTRTPEGGAYKREVATVGTDPDTGMPAMQVSQDPNPGRLVYDPAHPDADAEGFVAMPNVDVPEEMVDMLGATRAYQANLTAINLIRDTIQRALELGR